MLEPTVYRQFLRGYIDKAFAYSGPDDCLMLQAYLSKSDILWLKLRYKAVVPVDDLNTVIFRSVAHV